MDVESSSRITWQNPSIPDVASMLEPVPEWDYCLL